MEIKQSRTFGRLLWYCADDFALYVLHPAETHFDLVAVEAKTFHPIETSAIGYHPNETCSPMVDGDIIFLPAVDGRLIGIDKYSHDQVVDVDLGPMMAIRQPICDDTNIYTICAVPISNRPKIDTDISVVCVNDKQSGVKKAQSCVLVGQVSPLAVSDKIWVSNDKVLNRFSLNGEKEKSAQLTFKQIYPPQLSESAVFVLSPFGGIEIFDFNLKSKGKLMASRNNCEPARNGSDLYWPTRGTMTRVNLDTERVEKLSDIPFTPKGKAVFWSNHVYAATEEGNLLDFDVNTKTASHLHLGDTLRQPLLIEDHLFIASEKELFQICLTTQ